MGITLVGVSSLQSGEGSVSHPVTQWQMLGGMALIVASQARARLSPPPSPGP